jgi:hypothetical protein
LETDLILPLGQSAVSGVMASVLAGGVAVWARAARPLVVASVAGGAVVCVAWTVAMVDRRALMWRVETAIRRDLDGDGAVGQPEPLRLAYVHDPARHRRQSASDDLRYFLREVYGERGTTWRSWDGVLLPSGNRMAQPQWERYCDQLLRAGLASRAYPTAPLLLQSTYPEALRAFRELL